MLWHPRVSHGGKTIGGSCGEEREIERERNPKIRSWVHGGDPEPMIGKANSKKKNNTCRVKAMMRS